MTYECTVESTRGGATILKGNFIECCGSNELILHHKADSEGIIVSCNNNTITGQSVGVENNTYFTSQFNISFSTTLIGETIECIHDNGTFTSPAGNSIINGTGEV